MIAPVRVSPSRLREKALMTQMRRAPLLNILMLPVYRIADLLSHSCAMLSCLLCLSFPSALRARPLILVLS